MFKYQLPVIQDLKAVKTVREINFIIKAQMISERVLKQAISRFIVNEFKKQGIKALAFEPIVSFGKNTANIHHEPSKAKLKIGDIVMFDFGCTCNGYCSDMTRTYFFGQPNTKQKKVYLGVLEAQEKVLQALGRKERRCGKLDDLARKFLYKKFGKKSFPHGLGHGVGTAIHEWPNFKPKSSDILLPNMVMTVEPGVYMKNWGGVRIEDIVVITKDGCKNLTRVKKGLGDIIIK